MIRAAFFESWNRKTLSDHGLTQDFAQDNHLVSTSIGILRGLHFQLSPHARDIAAASLIMAQQLIKDAGKTGIYHFAGTPDVSWVGFARAKFAELGTDCNVTDTPSSECPTPVRRSLNSRLDCSSLETTFCITPPDWRQGASDILKDLENAS